ncbi:MAG: hypothetical protein R3D00_23410 [Bacteroidia bacterium]
MARNLFLNPIQILRLAAFALLLGRGWQFVFLQTPFHLWQENPGDTSWIISSIGVYWIICSVLVWFVKTGDRWLQLLLVLAVVPLLVMTFAMWQTSQYQLAQLIEQTAQWATPLLLLYSLSAFPGMWFSVQNAPSFDRMTLIVIALVFTGHGLYASGVFPQPANFHYMVTSILGVSGPPASRFLLAAGIVDFAVSIGIFLPRFRRLSLIYMTIWGLLTAFARIVAYVSPADLNTTLFEWLPQMLFRLPHGLLPLVIFQKNYLQKKKL